MAEKYKMDLEKQNPLYVGIKNELDSVGPGMCLAKWTQVTLSLQIGQSLMSPSKNTCYINGRDCTKPIGTS